MLCFTPDGNTIAETKLWFNDPDVKGFTNKKKKKTMKNCPRKNEIPKVECTGIKRCWKIFGPKEFRQVIMN